MDRVEVEVHWAILYDTKPPCSNPCSRNKLGNGHAACSAIGVYSTT